MRMVEALGPPPHTLARHCTCCRCLPWLLTRIKVRGFHANKLFASELLAQLLQQQPSNQQHLGQTDGILALLTAAAQCACTQCRPVHRRVAAQPCGRSVVRPGDAELQF